MYLRKRLAGLLAAAALGATVIVPLAAGSASAASCHAESCTNKDPYRTGCINDAETIYTVYSVGRWGTGVLQLRYSPTCAAAWAKIYNDGSFSFDTIIVVNTVGSYESQFVDQTDGSAYTYMVNDYESITSIACVSGGACTGSF